MERVKELLQCEVVNARYYEENDGWNVPMTALVAACARGHVDVVRLLLEYGGETQQVLEGAFC